jgi:predicted amidophosphoribosyltransferase
MDKIHTSNLETGSVVRVICMDDILTTGATMVSVRDMVLKKFPSAQVSFSALAH